MIFDFSPLGIIVKSQHGDGLVFEVMYYGNSLKIYFLWCSSTDSGNWTSLSDKEKMKISESLKTFNNVW